MKSAKGSKQCAVPQHSKLMFQLKDLLIFRPNYSLGDKDVPEISQEHSVSVGVGLSRWAKHDGYSSGQSASTLQQARQLLLASDQSLESGNITNCAEEMGSAQSSRPSAAASADVSAILAAFQTIKIIVI